MRPARSRLGSLVPRGSRATTAAVLVVGLSLAASEAIRSAQLGGISPIGQADRVVVRHIPVGTASIAGVVTAGDTGRPLSDVVVTVTGTAEGARGGGPPLVARIGGPPGAGSGLNRSVVTDGSGRFVVDRLPPGRYRVSANATRGFLPASHGQRAPGAPGAWIRLGDGERVDLALPLVRLATMVGTVFRNGEPLAGAYVQAFRFDWSSGVRRLMPNMGAPTDDRGVYRISNLQPGEYVVAATPSFNPMVDRARLEAAAFDAAVAATAGNSPVVAVAMPSGADYAGGQAPMFFPGTTAVGEAVTLRIAPGEVRDGLDIHVQDVRNGVVRGVVVLPPDVRASVQVTLIGDERAAVRMSHPSAAADHQGRFTLGNVPPGRYTVRALTTAGMPVQSMVVGGEPPVYVRPPGGARFWGSSTVLVESGQTTDVVMELTPGRTISGRIEFDGPAMAGQGPQITTQERLTLAVGSGDPASVGLLPQATVEPDGRFTIEGVVPGRYTFRAPGYLLSAVIDGVDVLDVPLDVSGDHDIEGIVITSCAVGSELSGTVTDEGGAPAETHAVIVMAVDRRYWTPGARRVVLTGTGELGRYQVRGLPPGDYLVAAVTAVEPGRHYDPDLLGRLAAGAARVTVVHEGRHVQDLRVVDP